MKALANKTMPVTGGRGRADWPLRESERDCYCPFLLSI